MKSITIFCSSSNGLNAKYIEPISKLTELLISADYTIICGGSSGGLMGELISHANKLGGRTIGIRPKFLDNLEYHSEILTEFISTDDIWERKKQMNLLSDATIALPGGSGTIDELFEAITLKRLGEYSKPIIIVNLHGFYDKLIDFFNHQIRENFMHSSSLNTFTVIESVDNIINALKDDNWKDENTTNAIIRE
ncbi:TIGR00730 family Rossman fold protein [Prolixibacteraceae bacterium JC049]|nr:TIGR00730 family Rossman fold protein [Prolixibacteraceae bacterium JC049]